jgi:hypothetical protein
MTKYQKIQMCKECPIFCHYIGDELYAKSECPSGAIPNLEVVGRHELPEDTLEERMMN